MLFSTCDWSRISSFVGEPFSPFRTTRSFDPEGDGTMTDTPDISMGKGDHWKMIEVTSVLKTWEYRIYFLLLFASRFGWLMENIAVDLSPAIMNQALFMAAW
jgi:hypothetical protein